MHVELEQLYVCHAYIKQARIEEFSSGGGGGVPTFRKILTSPPPKKKKEKPTKWRFSICSALVWLKFNLAIELLSRQYYIAEISLNVTLNHIKTITFNKYDLPRCSPTTKTHLT